MKNTENATEPLTSSDGLGRTFQPTMITRTEWEWLNLQDIAAACERLTNAVTARMSAGEDADGKRVWEMFEAHKACTDALKLRPNDQAQRPPGGER